MPQLNDLLQQGPGHAWLFIPTAILLGALHGLEPGHSKTMMAAFIIAVRGTVTQAVQLGVSAALSHTAVVWAVALAGLSYGAKFNAESSEAYFQIASAVAIVGIALWMIWQSWRDLDGDHDHHHHDDIKRIDTEHGVVALSIFEDGVPPRFRLQFDRGGSVPDAENVSIETIRPDGHSQVFALVNRGAYLESVDDISEPHAFNVRLGLGRGADSRTYGVAFAEHNHSHDHSPAALDAHALAHARAIETKFKGRSVTTSQIILFGLTGGLIPCPAAITVLLVCLQLKNVSLGFTLVLAFSLGLAITMVGAGVLAALSLRHVSTRWSGFGTFIHYAPLVSSSLVLLMGIYLGYLGLSQIA